MVQMAASDHRTATAADSGREKIRRHWRGKDGGHGNRDGNGHGHGHGNRDGNGHGHGNRDGNGHGHGHGNRNGNAAVLSVSS
jgi:hypothetical protein